MTTPKSIVFDIETCSLPESELAPFIPTFDPPANYKDPDKIKAALDAKRKDWIESCALDPITGRVLAIGMLVNGEFVLISEPATESTMLYEFWDAIQGGGIIHKLVGFNCFLFDLPFLIRRSWKLGLPVPFGVREGRYWNDRITDLRDVWQMGDRQASGSLDTIAKHLGIGKKSGSGADFAKLWNENREQAIAYIKNDLSLTAEIAKKLGVL